MLLFPVIQVAGGFKNHFDLLWKAFFQTKFLSSLGVVSCTCYSKIVNFCVAGLFDVSTGRRVD